MTLGGLGAHLVGWERSDPAVDSSLHVAVKEPRKVSLDTQQHVDTVHVLMTIYEEFVEGDLKELFAQQLAAVIILGMIRPEPVFYRLRSTIIFIRRIYS